MSSLVRQAAVSWRDHGLWRQKAWLEALLDTDISIIPPFVPPPENSTWLGWGRKRSGQRAQALAQRHGNGFLLLEDGFLRSFNLGVNGARPLSIVADGTGIYYDATRPSDLENMLNTAHFTPEELAQAEKAIAILREEGLSKYNSGLPVPDGTFPAGEKRVLVVDQTVGDASIQLGLATAGSFARMLRDAMSENPDATICVKTHPDVLAGKRRGHLTLRKKDDGIRYITENWHPHDLLRHFDKVYVVTSQMGLDALILGKEVHCFGMPFYAGWGLTHDRQRCDRRQARRSLADLVAAAYLRYAHYINPISGKRTDFFTVADILARQKRQHRFWAELQGAQPWSGRVFAFGFSAWKHEMMRPFFGEGVDLHYMRSVKQARRAGISAHDRIAVWGMRDPEGLAELVQELGLKEVRVEDGFIRSIGLGSDFNPPVSQVFDDIGIYFDPSRPSRLEALLSEVEFTPEMKVRTRKLREFIVENRLTKYNLGQRNVPALNITRKPGQKIILVPGQVEDDASILLGCSAVRTNMQLLQAVRAENPEAFLIYKPHPDVLSGNRKGKLHLDDARRFCDHVEAEADILACIDACDEVHTMTSLSGFDALLRGKKVVCYGSPFYAGWGLTEDVGVGIRRRKVKRDLDDLVAAALLQYPIYTVKGVQVTAETALSSLADHFASHRATNATRMDRLLRLAKNLLLSQARHSGR